MNPNFYELLDEMVPNPKCSLEYTNAFELLIATVLSAQSTDSRVNIITKTLFAKYDVFSLANANVSDVVDIIRPCGNMNKKAVYIIDIAKHLVADYNGDVPNNREYLESLKGVGHKTANVVLANIFNVPAFAVDTHVSRVSKRLGFALESDDVDVIEKKLMKLFPEEKWNRLHHQLLLFGRHICTSRTPHCEQCLLKDMCKIKKCK